MFTSASGIREDWLQAFFVGLCPEDKRKKTGTLGHSGTLGPWDMGHSDLVIHWITVYHLVEGKISSKEAGLIEKKCERIQTK